MQSKIPATKEDLEEAMKANVDAIEETEKNLRGEIQSSKKEVLDAIDRI